KQCSGAWPGRLLEHQIVSLQSQRIAWHQQTNMVVAAKRKRGLGLEVTPGQGRLELQHALGQRTGRYRHDRSACSQTTAPEMYIDAAAVVGEQRDRSKKARRQSGRELRQQGAAALAAKRSDVALSGPPQVLG